MQILVTGASGYIGHKLAHRLASQGHTVHALVRSRAKGCVLQHNNIVICQGDVQDKASLIQAANGCEQVYHAAAHVGAWARRPMDFYDVNVTGTKNVLEAAAASGVKKLVFTGSVGVLGPTATGPLTESYKRKLPFFTDYEQSKKEAEDLVLFAAGKLMDTVVVSPGKVYGPGHTSHSLTTNALIRTFLEKGVAVVPAPGTYQLCFSYIDDVVGGHLLAMEKGRSSERYILGGPNVSYFHFFNTIKKIAGSKGCILNVPKLVVKAWAGGQWLLHLVAGTDIRFTVKSVDLLFGNNTFSSEKAVSELGYAFTPLEEGIRKTILFLQQEKTHS